jgi:serine/threonine-protein kinase
MKPENVFLARIGGESVVKILDFGIGKAKSVASQVAGRVSNNEAGATAFTPAYGAPEQWAPRRYGQSGPWTDVWGLALTMVELMAGRSIIDGDQSAMMGTTLDPVRRPTPRTEGVTLGDAAEAVFARALAVDPRDRYTTAGEFWDALLTAHEADKSRQPKLSPMVMGNRAAGRSGAYSFRATPAPGPAAMPELGRHNLIPDLDVRASASAAIELDLGTKPAPSRSGQWRAPAPVAVTETAELDSSPDASEPLELDLPQRPEPSSGQWRAAASSVSVDEPARPLSQRPAPVGTARSGQWAAVKPEPARPSVPPSGADRIRSDRPRESVPGRSVPPARSIAPAPAVTAPVTSQRPSPSSGRPRVTPVFPVAPSPFQEMLRRFLAPALMIVVGILATLGNGAYASASGEAFTIGPIRLAWLATVLVIAGIVLAVYRILFDGPE